MRKDSRDEIRRATRSLFETLTAVVEKIDRDKALEYLKKNKRNRDISRTASRRYAEIIRRGEWMLTGQPIIFDRNGDLRDGQNRLQAIVESNVAVDILVVRGVDEKAIYHVDVGLRRGAHHALQMGGELQSKHLAAAIRMTHSYKAGKPSLTESGVGVYAMTNADVEKCLSENTGLRESVRKCNTKEVARIVPAARLACAHYLFSDIDKDKADEFIYMVRDGANMPKDHPILRLRELLLNDKTRNVRRRTMETLALVIKAWNLWREGKFIKSLRYEPDREEYPIAK